MCPFAKLRKAVRYGGGGMYGVVTAAKYQFHKHRPLYRIVPNWTVYEGTFRNCNIHNTCREMHKAVAFLFVEFFSILKLLVLTRTQV